jgi:hypothetical protein
MGVVHMEWDLLFYMVRKVQHSGLSVDSSDEIARPPPVLRFCVLVLEC